MTIPPQKIQIKLLPDTPTELTPASLQEQLHDIGLTCEETDVDRLKFHIEDVRKDLPNGKVHTLGTYKKVDTRKGVRIAHEKLSNGQWYPDGGFGYQTELTTIQHEENFLWLEENQSGFTGVKDYPPEYSGRETTVDIVKEEFVKIAYAASSTIIDGLDKESTEATFENAIETIDDSNSQDYAPGWIKRSIVLVDRYDPDSEDVYGLGVLGLEWDLKIKDFKEKKGDFEKDWSLKIKARSVLYSTVSAMCKDYCVVASRFQTEKYFLYGLPVPDIMPVDVLPHKPPADVKSFVTGIPLKTTSEYVEVLILHSPHLEQIGCVVNEDSDSPIAWTTSMTTGLSFGKQLEFYPVKYEVSTVVSKKTKSLKLGSSLSGLLAKSGVETVNVSVLAHKNSFVYQGTFDCSILRFDPRNANCSGKVSTRSTDACPCGFEYMGEGKLRTSVVMNTRCSLI